MPSSVSAGQRVVEARFVASAPEARLLPPPTGVEVAFAGRSNVGKSTLLNALLERKGLARTSGTPGCTRELIVFEAKAIDGAIVTLVDLPGYGYAKRSKTERSAWAELVEDYLRGRPTLTAVIVLVDIRRGVEDDDRDVLELIAAPPLVSRRPVSALLVATKLDKLPVSARKPALARLAKDFNARVAGFSADDHTSHANLWREVRRLAGIPQGVASADSPPLSSRSQSP
ncbi:MAG TPA: ribosome biogenesis GTP-binding protein YihA/YsxC [Polyangiaceae bacterium]|jgi:GTP-binding protein|nr:ribosome biogenesis GTP-binding protein YihA/YsxC [Polyangiaceae bacterium]